MNNNNDISLRIKHIREQAGETLSEFSRNVGIPRSTLVGYENQSTIPASILHIISCKYNISEEWLLSGIGEINKLQKQPFAEPSQGIATGYKNSLKQSVSNSFESLALESTAPKFAELEEKLNSLQKDLQAQIDELKGAVEKKQIEEAYNSPPAYTPDPKLRPYSDLYVAESQSSYGLKKESSEPEETEDLPLAENLAAGIPIEAFDSGETYPVPKKFLKRGKKYCVAKIKGTSMTETGIIDGSFVLLEYTDTALSGEIMVVKYGEQTTLKRLSQKEDGSWELLYEDGSGAVIPLKDGDWEVKGHYVRVVGGDCKIRNKAV